MIFEHYGSKHFDKKMFEGAIYDADDEYLNKPSKGFWGSPIDSQNSWKNFCISEDFNVSSLKRHFKFGLKRFARVLKVLNEKDLEPIVYLIHHIDDLSAKFGQISVSML